MVNSIELKLKHLLTHDCDRYVNRHLIKMGDFNTWWKRQRPGRCFLPGFLVCSSKNGHKLSRWYKPGWNCLGCHCNLGNEVKLLKKKRRKVVLKAGFVVDCRVSALVYLVLITTLRPPQCKHSESNIVDESWLVRRRLSLCSTEARKHLALLKGLNFWVSWVESYQCLLPREG